MKQVSFLLITMATLLIGKADLASAQANCPSTDNLSFINGINGTVVTSSTLSNKRATIMIGSIPFLSGYTNLAWIWLDGGSCQPYWLSYDGVNIATMLTKHTNLCLGYKDDEVDNIVYTHGPFTCAGQTYTAYGMLYNGYRLHTYTGGGADEVWGSGSGTDRIYGGSGDDFLNDWGGASDRIYGETDKDDLVCSPASNSICDGGGAPDVIDDYAGGVSHTIQGGGSSDDIQTCAQLSTIDCGESAPGYSDSDVLLYRTGVGNSHSNCESASAHPYCGP